MAHPARNARPEAIRGRSRMFFATTKTSLSRRLLQSERNALLLIEVLRLQVATGHLQLHNFVIMPDHLHLLMTVSGRMTIEKAMQLIKGGFSIASGKSLAIKERSGNEDFPNFGSVTNKALLIIAIILSKIQSKQGSLIAQTNTHTATHIWRSRKAQGLKALKFEECNGPTEVVPDTRLNR